MEYTVTVEINAARDTVWAAFDNPDNMPRWQPTLVSFETVSGQAGEPDAESALTYTEGKRTIVLTEIIDAREPPSRFAGRYIMGSTTNWCDNTFEALDDNRTAWTMASRFEFGGFWRLLAPFMRGMIRKRTRTDMERFKTELEAGNLETDSQ